GAHTVASRLNGPSLGSCWSGGFGEQGYEVGQLLLSEVAAQLPCDVLWPVVQAHHRLAPGDVRLRLEGRGAAGRVGAVVCDVLVGALEHLGCGLVPRVRSEERRVGEERRSRTLSW